MEYKGNCHCGTYKFSIKLDSPLIEKQVSSCDCSYCSKNGALWLFPVTEDDLTVHTGEDSLQIYEFGSHTMPYSFCPKCGSVIRVQMKGNPVGGINVRMLKDINIDSLQLKSMGGSSYGAAYEQPTFPTHEEIEKLLDVHEGLKIYNGNCHCKAVTYSVATKSLEEQKVMSCNCSLCSKHGDLYIYPHKNQVVVHTGAKNLMSYERGSFHTFCRLCGVSVLVRLKDEGKHKDICPVNVRTLVDYPELKKKGLKMQYYDGKAADPQYSIE